MNEVEKYYRPRMNSIADDITVKGKYITRFIYRTVTVGGEEIFWLSETFFQYIN